MFVPRPHARRLQALAAAALIFVTAGPAPARTTDIKTITPRDPTPAGRLITVAEETYTIAPSAPVVSLFGDDGAEQAFLDELNGAISDDLAASLALTMMVQSPVKTPVDNDPFLLDNPGATGLMVYLTDFHDGGSSGTETYTVYQGTTQAGNTVGDGYATETQAYVFRYVGGSGLPMIDDPDAPLADLFDVDNRIATLDPSELVRVDDTLPVNNGGQVLVDVQRTSGAMERGWFPLFWLHESPGADTEGDVSVALGYSGFSRAVEGVLEQVFYDECSDYGMHPFGAPFTNPGAGAGYECGEYPIGSLSNTMWDDGLEYKRLVGQSYTQEVPEVTFGIGLKGGESCSADAECSSDICHEGKCVLFKPLAGIRATDPVTVPFYVGRRQARGAPYDITQLGYAYPWEQGEEVSHPVYGVTDDMLNDDQVRVHSSDVHFKFASSLNEEYPGELQFCVRMYLPGVEVHTGTAPAHIELWHDPLLKGEKTAVIDEVSLGSVQIDSLPVEVCGAFTVAVDNGPDDDDTTRGFAFGDPTFVANGGGTINTSTNISMRIASVNLVATPELTWTRDASFSYAPGSEASVTSAVLGGGTALSNLVVRFLLQSGAAWDAADGETLNFTEAFLNDFDPLGISLSNLAVWDAAGTNPGFDSDGIGLKYVLQDMLLDTLRDMAGTLSASFPQPKRAMVRGCNAIFPPSYRKMTSPFYGLYTECTRFGGTLEVRPFVNRPVLGAGYGSPTQNIEAWANVGQHTTGAVTTDSPADICIWPPANSDETGSICAEEPFSAAFDPHIDHNGAQRWGTGKRLEAEATGHAHPAWFDLFRCVATEVSDYVDDNPLAVTVGGAANQLRNECLGAALDGLCTVYGDADDLIEMWNDAHGTSGAVAGYHTYCAWADEVNHPPEDTPDFTTGG